MSDDRAQALAGVRLLTRFCWLDREIDEPERAELRGFAGLDIDDATIDAYLREEGALEDVMDDVTDDDIREQVLATARRITRGHRSSHEEQLAIAKIRDAWGCSLPEPDDPATLKGRETDITELARRFMHREASLSEMVRKIKDDLGED